MRAPGRAAAILLVMAAAGCGNDDGANSMAEPARETAGVEFVSPASVSSPATTAIKLDGQPGAIVAAEGGVWVAIHRGAHDSGVARIDPTTNGVLAKVPVEGNPNEIAGGEGFVWVTGNFDKGGDVIQRIDPQTNRVVSSISFACCWVGTVAAGEGAAWLVLTDREDRSASIARLDPDTDEVTLTIPLEAGPARHNFDELAVSPGAVWVLALAGLDDPGDIVRIDPRTNRVAARIQAKALNMGAGSGGLWVSGCIDCDEYRDTFFAQEIDPDVNAPAGPRIAVEKHGFGPLFVGEEAVWFAGSNSVVFRLDRETKTIGELLRIGPFVHSGMAFDARNQAIWIARSAPASVLRVELDAGPG